MTHAMILAAGRGERMRPLTDTTPKPLLKIDGKPIIEHHIQRLVKAGYDSIVINTNHFASQIEDYLGNGDKYSVRIVYSSEQPDALETGGGIFQALPELGKQPFCVINGDIFCDHNLIPPPMTENTLSHLVLVNNPEHNPDGDFGIYDGSITNQSDQKWTFSGIGWYRPQLFNGCVPGKFPLAPLLRAAADKNRISGEIFTGLWMDIGTPDRLNEINRLILNRAKSG